MRTDLEAARSISHRLWSVAHLQHFSTFLFFVSFLGTTVSLAYLTSLPPLLEIDHEGRDLVLLIATPLNPKLHWPRQVQGSTVERWLQGCEAESMCWGLYPIGLPHYQTRGMRNTGGRRPAGTTPASHHVPVSSAARGLKPKLGKGNFGILYDNYAYLPSLQRILTELMRTRTHTLVKDELCSSKISTLKP